MERIAIAIDGPSAAGKSTIAKLIAKQLNYAYIDTGAMYRCVAYYVKTNGIDIQNEDLITSILTNIHIHIDQNNNVFLNDQNVSGLIRSDEISMMTSKVSSYQAVRTFLVEQQRLMALSGGVILDGRDIGTVVLPNAQLKIYQQASVKTRAMRRYKENLERGMEADLEAITKDIEQRDYQDMNRAISPLKKAEDAIEIDTSTMSLQEVVDEIMNLVKKVGL
ncbi:(d)CMP kinase [Tannockella kyphosi]|uniref:(d)CMP kinase n=1 Tax=Tannockella kyphosi TaxID=2899121 RepID=UPI0020125FC2|nr:(d)CMP kinase [Tannockella kyphosi]